MLMLGLKVKVSSAQGTTKTNRNPTSKRVWSDMWPPLTTPGWAVRRTVFAAASTGERTIPWVHGIGIWLGYQARSSRLLICRLCAAAWIATRWTRRATTVIRAGRSPRKMWFYGIRLWLGDHLRSRELLICRLWAAAWIAARLTGSALTMVWAGWSAWKMRFHGIGL